MQVVLKLETKLKRIEAETKGRCVGCYFLDVLKVSNVELRCPATDVDGNKVCCLGNDEVSYIFVEDES